MSYQPVAWKNDKWTGIVPANAEAFTLYCREVNMTTAKFQYRDTIFELTADYDYYITNWFLNKISGATTFVSLEQVPRRATLADNLFGYNVANTNFDLPIFVKTFDAGDTTRNLQVRFGVVQSFESHVQLLRVPAAGP